MRRLIITILGAAVLAGGVTAAPTAAVAGDHHYDRYSEHRGYWERPGDRRRWSRHRHRRHRGPTVHYYPGYGYYESSGHRGYRADQRGGARARSAWCARQYRSYDWRTGTFVGYDGVRRYCG